MSNTATSTHQAELRLEGLGKSFVPGKPVLAGIDLQIPPGQFVAIIGKSGCGKSTLLRLLAGLEQPSTGRLSYGIANGASRATVRIMFQEPRLLPWERVADNIIVGLDRQHGRTEQQARAHALLARVGLADHAGDWPATLSGGQKQRVALARALASQPDVLALDEPLGALDALTRLEMQRLLEEIWLQQRFTAVLVTHDVAEALALADRVILIEQGRVSLDLPVTLPRPRKRGGAELARLEGMILDHLFQAAT